MRFMATADTDTGECRKANQDSLLIRHKRTDRGEVLLCVICDGLGGLSEGELASATVIRAFSDWFDKEFGGAASAPDLGRTAKRWQQLIEALNREIGSYGDRHNIRLGTTFSGILFVGHSCLVCHVGDSRIYHIGGQTRQLTQDQTLAARELGAGRLTKRQAVSDEGRNVLLQCVGASASVEPQTAILRARSGVYMLCSDGLYHETTAREMRETLSPVRLADQRSMHSGARRLIGLARSRGETDNISAVVVRVRGGRAKGPGRYRG